jgi:hypothetical protein
MDIEIEDGDAPQAVHVQCMCGADGDVIEKTEAHCPIVFGVVTGRANGTERVRSLARQNGIGRRDNGARRM